MKSLLSALGLLAMVGCAVAPPAPQEGKTQVCHREKPTGLAHYVKVCRDADEVARHEKESRQMMDNVRQPPASEQSLGR
ncbi:hypothetical protein [Roseateles sp. LKC17W]|uniref:Lipoprotein n=1 Tax=Pelomonas margarita TaxID=3299031 RepID=A0ABW7FDW5_9BURK